MFILLLQVSSKRQQNRLIKSYALGPFENEGTADKVLGAVAEFLEDHHDMMNFADAACRGQFQIAVNRELFDKSPLESPSGMTDREFRKLLPWEVDDAYIGFEIVPLGTSAPEDLVAILREAHPELFDI